MFFGPNLQGTASADCLLEASSSTADIDVRLTSTHSRSTDSGSDSSKDENRVGLREEFEDVPPRSTSSGPLVECPVCLLEKGMEEFPEIQTCHHRSCSTCLKQYFKIEIMESRVGIACPECSELFHPNDIKLIVEDDHIMQKYEDFMMRRVLAVDPDTRWCPAPDCGYAVIAAGCASCPKLRCERDGCNTNFCYHCKQYWHPNQTCDAARAERSPNIRSVSVSYSQESAIQNEIKSCPRCAAFIIKMDDESCNHMTCAVCEAHFCWLCLKEVSDLHYLSPSGCTFWGRKPWSRKKKILWQLGILVGAPVGITLVAGLAVPAMIIGIPVWVGKKVHYRYELDTRRRRGLAIAGSVTASIFAAPVIATLAVGVGVPILLAYIYGVVPISLCRSGGCGVTTTNSGGVRFEFDEDTENNTRGDYHSMETGPNVANPSIAPSIGDASLGMTNSLSASGSHMDRVGVLRDDSDRDSSSHRAIAGTSINGSLCSGTYSTQHHKLEVQADISEHGGLCERGSMGGESYNMSLNDDASTRALAGSIISKKDKDGVSVCSRLFDGSTGVPSSAPLVYPEEVDEKDRDVNSVASGLGNVSNVATAAVISPSASASSAVSSSASSNAAVIVVGGQANSSSCPTSPNLRKSSNIPATSNGASGGGEEVRNPRGKKCTRFMDQVPEIDDFRGDDTRSVDSVISGGSGNGLSHPAAAHAANTDPSSHQRPPTYSTMSLTSSSAITSTAPVLNSCQSLISDEESTEVGMKFCGTGHRLLGKKAESTSVLLGSAERRQDVMGDGEGCRKGDSGTSMQSAGEDGDRTGSNQHHYSASCSLRSSKNKTHSGRKVEKKQHGSQPIHLSDISQVSEGMSVHHAGGCQDLLAVMDASGSEGGKLVNRGGVDNSCGIGYMGRKGNKVPYFHTSITSSSCSSVDESSHYNSDLAIQQSNFHQNRRLSSSSSPHDVVFGTSLDGVEETKEVNENAGDFESSYFYEQTENGLCNLSGSDTYGVKINYVNKSNTPKSNSIISDDQQSVKIPENFHSKNASNATSSLDIKEIIPSEGSTASSSGLGANSKRDSSSVSIIGNNLSLVESSKLPEVEVTSPYILPLCRLTHKDDEVFSTNVKHADQSNSSLSSPGREEDQACLSSREVKIEYNNRNHDESASSSKVVKEPILFPNVTSNNGEKNVTSLQQDSLVYSSRDHVSRGCSNSSKESPSCNVVDNEVLSSDL